MSAPVRLCFDESGYTGFNLRDTAQPIFALASTSLDDDEAQEILSAAFPTYQAPEFKASNIWRAARARRSIPAFLKAISARKDAFFVWATNKEFLTFTKMIDSLAEPVIRSNGLDFYKDAWGRKFCNHHFAACLTLEGRSFVSSLCGDYFAFSDDPTQRALDQLIAALECHKQSCAAPIAYLINILLEGAQHWHDHSTLDAHRRSNEFQFTAMLTSVGHWRRRRDEDFIVCHDVMSDFFRRRDTWEKVTSPTAPAQYVDTADGLGIEFPLRVVRTDSEDSKNSHAIQIADVLAGIVAKTFDQNARGTHQALFDEIFSDGALDLNFDGVLPQSERIEGPPAPLIGGDMVDQFNRVLFRDEP